MSSKFAKSFQIPPEYPDILKDFTREVLRNQPANINEFAAKYFDCLASGLPADMAERGKEAAAKQDEAPDMSLEEVESIILELFQKYDKDQSQYLDPGEFKNLMEDLQQRLDFPKDQIYLFLAEADMNADGHVEYHEFIPLALQIIQSMYAKKRLEQHISDVGQHAEDLLVHGMSRQELTELVGSIFERMDQDQSGQLSKQEFVAALGSMELGLTRKEINAIMFQIDRDEDGNISYGEFVPFAFDLLQKLTSLRLLETELEQDELAKFLTDLFKARDTEMAGMLTAEDVRDLLHQAALGLTRMQIYTVISEAEVNAEGNIPYPSFVPRAVGLIRSMLSFEKCIVTDQNTITPEMEQQFFAAVEEVFGDKETTSLDGFLADLAQGNLVDEKELGAIRILLHDVDPEQIPVQQAITETWALLKSMRRAPAVD
jgi:Ca2+-binding EF-hand superfamily protein